MKTSNKFTFIRVVLAPVFFILYFIPLWTGHFVIGSAFILLPLLGFMEFTDYLDGHYARKNNEVSDFGKMFDPFADVIVHLTTFTCFMLSGKITGSPFGYLHPALFILIVYREFSMNFMRMAAAKKGVAIAARKGGKFKTVLYVISGLFVVCIETLLRLGINISAQLPGFHIAATILFSVSVVACYGSFIDYLVHFKSVFDGV
ncbi:MAG: CDP-alcohol phosphatidyltransferase family protein [Treponema sp.]|jgi:CDP-diacylglycerol--glycerol-3-phosphate 3-phosphatidyltransferase|nr:CDP-alcohol phosphatidyltransferase family protein [Treponema sp.]